MIPPKELLKQLMYHDESMSINIIGVSSVSTPAFNRLMKDYGIESRTDV